MALGLLLKSSFGFPAYLLATMHLTLQQMPLPLSQFLVWLSCKYLFVYSVAIYLCNIIW